MCVDCLESKVTTGSGEGCSTVWQRERGTSGRIIKDGLAEKKNFPCLGEISGISGLVNGFQSEVSP